MSQIKPDLRTSGAETEFSFNGFRYAAQAWGRKGQLPVLAIHGWLDNSASFDVLAPLLKDVHIIAPDLAGHGKSDHFKGLSDYPVWSEIMAFFSMADAMGWEQFALIGHSRGAMMSLLTAAIFPERISHLVLLDALAPPPVEASQSPERMMKSIKEINRRLQRPLSCYPSYEAAIQARCNSDVVRVDKPTAERLAARGLIHLDEGFHWHADGKLWAPSNVALTADQIAAFVKKITAKTLILLAKDGLKSSIKHGSDYEILLNKLTDQLGANVQEFNDGHYLHMESAVDDVAESIQTFLFDNNFDRSAHKNNA